MSGWNLLQNLAQASKPFSIRKKLGARFSSSPLKKGDLGDFKRLHKSPLPHFAKGG
jgi:hypothetical protein